MTHPTSDACHPSRLAAVFGVLVLLAGCPARQATDSSNAAGDNAAKQPLLGSSLTLLVVGDPELASALRQMEGEWNGQTGGTYQVQSAADQDPLPEDKLDADVVICPSYHLGELAERGAALPLPDNLLRDAQGKLRDSEGNWPDIFSLVRAHEASWRGRAIAVPLGSPVLVCYYRADLLERLGRAPPRTWSEYQSLAELLADRKNLGDAAPPDDQPWHGALEPLGPDWGALVLLARAAAYATHRGNYSTVFHVDSMDPLIDGPPFVRALEELVAAARVGPSEPEAADPVAVRNAFWAGQCGMALSWPTAAAKLPGRPSPGFRVGFVELPGAADVYNVSGRCWEIRREREEPHVPLLAAAGRIGLISRRSASPDEACRLLLWLSDDQWSRQTKPVGASSPMTTLFRHSHTAAPQNWVEDAIPDRVAKAYAEQTARTLSRERAMLALPIPGRSQYLAALQHAVHEALHAKLTPEAALRHAAATWQQLTDRLGRKSQRAAYGHSVGLQ